MRQTTLINDATRLDMAIGTIIADKHRDNESFSAHDITKALRSKYPHEEIDHDTIKNLVHSRMQNDTSFTRSNKGGYFLYGPVAISQMVKVPLTTTQTTVVAPAVALYKFSLRVGTEGRLCVPQKATELIGSASQEFYVRNDTNEIVISTAPLTGGKKLHSDNHANIRVRTGWVVGDKATCVLDTGKLVITK